MTTEDEMVGWHHPLNGQEFEKTPGDGEGQESLVCCNPWGCKESDMTEQLNNKQMSVNRGMDKEDVVHTHTHTCTHYYSATKRSEIVPFAEKWMDLKTVIESKVSQKEKNKNCIISLVCGI